MIATAALAIDNRLAPRAEPRHGGGDGLDARPMSIAVTALRTGIDPNVLAGADLARRIPISGCIRFAPARPPAMARSGLL